MMFAAYQLSICALRALHASEAVLMSKTTVTTTTTKTKGG